MFEIFRDRVFRVTISFQLQRDVVVDVFARDEEEAMGRAVISQWPWAYIEYHGSRPGLIFYRMEWWRVLDIDVCMLGLDTWMLATGQPQLL